MPLVRRGEPPADWRTAMYYRYYHYPQDHRMQPHYGVRTATEKLIFFNKINAWEYYDLTKDPDELRNLYGDPQYRTAIDALKAQLERVKKAAKDEDQFAHKLPEGGVDPRRPK